MNHIPKIAKMLGVEIGEEFYLKGFDEEKTEFNYVRKNKHVLKNDGIYITDDKGHCDKSILLDDVISGKLEIVKLSKPILTDKEKKYLSGIIEPWRDDFECIYKRPYGYDEEIGCKTEYICIITNFSTMPFPMFKAGTKYKGLELYKKYSLEELGL